MNVSHTPALERFVAAKVDSGLYTNASEVIREGLRLLKEHDDIRLKWREQIERGWLQAQVVPSSTGTNRASRQRRRRRSPKRDD